MSRSRKPGAGDYTVGYGRPPVATRFKPGQSGNAAGRPKKPKTVADDLRAALGTRIVVTENGRRKSYTARAVILRTLVQEAARKNMRAIATLFALEQRYCGSDDVVLDPMTLSPEDRDIVQALIDEVTAAGTSAAAANAEPETEATGDDASSATTPTKVSIDEPD